MVPRRRIALADEPLYLKVRKSIEIGPDSLDCALDIRGWDTCERCLWDFFAHRHPYQWKRRMVPGQFVFERLDPTAHDICRAKCCPHGPGEAALPTDLQRRAAVA